MSLVHISEGCYEALLYSMDMGPTTFQHEVYQMLAGM